MTKEYKESELKYFGTSELISLVLELQAKIPNQIFDSPYNCGFCGLPLDAQKSDRCMCD